MRRLRDLDYETYTCSLIGHDAPAARVRGLRPVDADVGIDLDDGSRLARCLRCDAWVREAKPSRAEHSSLAELEPLDVPKRGRRLRTTIIFRLIALERVLHVVFFGLLTVALVIAELELGSLQELANSLIDRFGDAASESRRGGAFEFLGRWLRDLMNLSPTTLLWLIVLAGAFTILETIEAVGLWFEKRWVEYLTVIETSVFLPYEIYDLSERVTGLRVAALVVNILIVIYIIWSKRLFGLARLHPIPEDKPPDISPAHLAPTPA